MKRKLYIHIGPHKTGTTYIQKYLYLNKGVLEKYGIIYPEPYCLDPSIESYGHHDIEEIGISRYLDSIEGSGLESVLLSSETISTYDTDVLKIIKEESEKRGYHTLIIYYYRNPFDRTRSQYIEDIKWGGIEKITDYFLKHFSKPFQSKVLNLQLTLEKFENIFGKENLIIIDYDYYKTKNILYPLLELIGVNIEEFNIREELVNKSPDMRLIEILRILNLKARNEGILRKNNVRNALFSLLKEKKDDVKPIIDTISDNMESENIIFGNFLTELLHNNLKRRYLENFYKTISSEPPKSFSLEYISDSWLFNDGIMDLLHNLYLLCKNKLTERREKSMIINNTYKFIFIHIPKAAGTSITNFFAQFTKWCDLEIGGTSFGENIAKYYSRRFKLAKHSPAFHVKKIVGDEIWNSYFKFSFVRNPYTRVYSAYNFLKKWENIPEKHKQIVDKFSSFEEFILSDLFPEYKGPDNIFMPQVYWIYDEQNTNLLIDFIGKIENINNDVEVIVEKLNLKDAIDKIGIPKLNKSVELDPKVFENGKVIDKIRYVYEIDFERFEYSKDVEDVFK